MKRTWYNFAINHFDTVTSTDSDGVWFALWQPSNQIVQFDKSFRRVATFRLKSWKQPQ
jgi:hypothetical protein